MSACRHAHIVKATSVIDLRSNTPEWIDTRAGTCNSSLINFDVFGGILQFRTQSSLSSNSWVQSVMFVDWYNLVTFEPGAFGLNKPVEKETDEEIPITVEPTPEFHTESEPYPVKPNDNWENVLRAYPELMNADVQVYCDCPFVLWRGPQYNLEQRNTMLHEKGVPAPREKTEDYPHGRAPEAWSNIICKHLAAVLNQHF